MVTSMRCSRRDMDWDLVSHYSLPPMLVRISYGNHSVPSPSPLMEALNSKEQSSTYSIYSSPNKISVIQYIISSECTILCILQGNCTKYQQSTSNHTSHPISHLPTGIQSTNTIGQPENQGICAELWN
jgi:hypothetical protein